MSASTQAPSAVADVFSASASSRERFQPDFRFYAAFGSLCVVTLAVALDATSLSVALPVSCACCYFCFLESYPAVQIISQDLNGSAIEAFWSGTSFLLASTIFQLIFGAMSESFGRKNLVIISLVLFTVGAIVAAAARNFAMMLAGRTLQGTGGGGIISLFEILITDLVPLRDRGTWFGYQSAIWAIGSVTGPVVGGAFAANGAWRWIFWINLPICGLGFVAVVMFLNLSKVPGAFLPKVTRFDWAGVVLLAGSTTAFLMSISWGNVMFPWSSWRTFVPLILGLLGLVGFVFYEARVAKEPIIRIAIFKQRTALVCYLGTFIHGIILWSLLYYLPLYYECVKDYTPVISGVAAFPETFTVAPASIVVGVLVSKWGRFRWAIWIGWSLSVLGMGLLYLLTPRTTIPEWLFLNLVAGLGLGMLFSSLGYGTQAAAEEKDVAFAASMYTFSRSFGQSIGVAIGGAIFQSQFAVKLKEYPTLAGRASDLSRDASALVQIVKAMDKSSPERAMIVEAYADSLKVVWAVMAGLAFVGLVASAFAEGLDLNRQGESEQKLEEKAVSKGPSPA
jgi:MFS family permease